MFHVYHVVCTSVFSYTAIPAILPLALHSGLALCWRQHVRRQISFRSMPRPIVLLICCTKALHVKERLNNEFVSREAVRGLCANMLFVVMKAKRTSGRCSEKRLLSEVSHSHLVVKSGDIFHRSHYSLQICSWQINRTMCPLARQQKFRKQSVMNILYCQSLFIIFII